MQDCQCTELQRFENQQKEINRILVIVDGKNGKKPLCVYLEKIITLEKDINVMTENVKKLSDSTELLRRNVSAMVKADEIKIKTKADIKKERRQSLKDIAMIITLILLATGTIYQIFFK